MLRETFTNQVKKKKIFFCQPLRRYVLEALRTASALGNMQLKALVLTVLGLLFHATQHEQSSKMLTSAHSINEKINNKHAIRIIKEALQGKGMLLLYEIPFYKPLLTNNASNQKQKNKKKI